MIFNHSIARLRTKSKNRQSYTMKTLSLLMSLFVASVAFGQIQKSSTTHAVIDVGSLQYTVLSIDGEDTFYDSDKIYSMEMEDILNYEIIKSLINKPYMIAVNDSVSHPVYT